MSNVTRSSAAIPVMAIAVIGLCIGDITSPQAHAETVGSASLLVTAVSPPFQVSGSGIIFTATEVVHSSEPTATGLIQRSSVAAQLSGDLNGSILFNPTSSYDFVNGLLVNTGTQYFSGTIAGSRPVVLYDDSFRFDINLSTGETHGTVHFSRSGDTHNGGWFECDLVVVGTGITADGDITSDYTGNCVQRGYPD